MRQSVLTLGIVGATILGSASAGSFAVAQSAPAVATTSFNDTLVVSASLEAEPADDLPVSVTKLDAATIADRQLLSVADAIATTPGVTVARSGGPGNVTSLFLRGTDSTHTLVLWNGVALNDPLFGAFDFGYLPLDGAERVEVVRGPASALYGGEALAGVVQVVTARHDALALRLEGGENAYQRAALAGGHNLGRLHVDLAGHHRRGDGELANDDFASDDLLLRGEVSLGDQGKVGAIARGNDSVLGQPWSGGQPQLHQRSTWVEHEVAVPVSWEAGRWSLAGQLAGTASAYRYRNPDDPYFTRGDSEAESRRARAVATLRNDLGWLAAGAEWQRLEGTSASDYGVAIDQRRQSSRAVFVDGHASWGQLELHGGAREDNSDVYGSHLSPRGGVVWAVQPELRLRASWGEGFRAPSLGELYYPGSGNAALEPEESRAAELGVDYVAGPWAAQVALFDIRLANLIDFDFATYQNLNIGRARSRGVEVSLGWRGALAAVEVNGTRLDAIDLDTRERLLRRPEQSANLTVRVYPGRLMLYGTGRYVGARPDVDPVTFARVDSPSYTRLDLGARLTVNGWLAPYGRIENVADRRYAEVAGYPAPRRTLVGGIALTF
jgi:vitamin B12 transporter